MITSDATQVPDVPGWSDPRVHLLDDAWLLTIFAILIATALPWFVSGFQINFVAASLGLLALGAIHIGLAALGRPARPGERRLLLSVLHVSGVLVVGFIWMNVGGVQNPAFLMVFALPVVGAIFLSRWQPYLMALVSVLVALMVAAVQAPELRWYLPGLGASAGFATALGLQGAINVPFPGFSAPSGYFIVVLEVFATLIVACAVAAEYLGTIFERLHAHVDAARDEAERGQEFWATLIEHLPLPALLIDRDSLRILCASARASGLCATGITPGQSLFENIRFSYPDVVQTLIAEADGVVPLSMVHTGDRIRATRVHVQHLARSGSRLALIVIEDLTSEVTANMALDVTGQAVIVIDSRNRVVAFNKPARVLFANIEIDADAAAFLSINGTSGRWWDPGITGRRKLQVEIGPRVYEVVSSAAPLPGEEERLHVVTLQPMARAALGNQGTAAARTALDAVNALRSNRRVSP